MKNYVKQDGQGNLSIHTVTGFVPTDAICELPAGIPVDEADTLDVVGNTVAVNPTKKAAYDAAKVTAAAAKADADSKRAARLTRLKAFTASAAFANLNATQQQALQDIVDHLVGK
jgi:membrane protein involved in colicin uptake